MAMFHVQMARHRYLYHWYMGLREDNKTELNTHLNYSVKDEAAWMQRVLLRDEWPQRGTFQGNGGAYEAREVAAVLSQAFSCTQDQRRHRLAWKVMYAGNRTPEQELSASDLRGVAREAEKLRELSVEAKALRKLIEEKVRPRMLEEARDHERKARQLRAMLKEL